MNDRAAWRQVSFGNGNQAVLSDGRDGDVAGVIARMGLTPSAAGRPVIVVCGGAKGLIDGELERASAIIGAALASAAEVTGAVLVDGGTAAGVMRLTGQARARWSQALPVLVGVAPAGLVTYPGGPAGDGVTLEENHSHFILADSSEWGGETRLLIAAAERLAGGGRVIMVLAGGGKVATSEVLEAARRHWPVFALAGTGGLADSLIQLWTEHRVPRRRFAAPVLPGKRKFRPRPPPFTIADPNLREIISQGDIRPVTDTEPWSLARRLAWELQEEPVLKDAWQRFATYDHLAIRLRRMFTRFQASILVLGVVATLLALIDNKLKESALHWAVIVVPIVVSVLIAVASRRAVGQRWVMLRAAAESTKAEIYRYRTSGTAHAGGHARTAGARRQLAAQLNVIETRLMQTEVSSGPLTPYEGPLPPEMYGAGRDDDGLSPLGPDRYLRIRVGDQLAYFHQRTRTLNRLRNRLQFLAIASGAAGAILAAANLEVWIGLTAGAAAAALAYVGYLQVDNTIVTYNQTAARLDAQERGWRALSPAQQDEAAFRHLVTSCEAALAREQSGWVQQMNDTLEDLRRNQADEADRVEHPGNGPWRRSDADDSAAEATGVLRQAVGEGAQDRGGAAGDLQPAVDVLQVGAHGALRQVQAPGDLGIGVPARDQAQQVRLPRGEPGPLGAAALGVQVGLVQVRADQGEQGPVAFGEVRSGKAEQVQPDGPAGPAAGPGWLGQAQLGEVLSRPWNEMTSQRIWLIRSLSRDGGRPCAGRSRSAVTIAPAGPGRSH